MDQLPDTRYWSWLFKMGLSRFFILRVLYKIANLTSDCCSLTEAAIYPVLKEFVQGRVCNF